MKICFKNNKNQFKKATLKPFIFKCVSDEIIKLADLSDQKQARIVEILNGMAQLESGVGYRPGLIRSDAAGQKTRPATYSSYPVLSVLAPAGNFVDTVSSIMMVKLPSDIDYNKLIEFEFLELFSINLNRTFMDMLSSAMEKVKEPPSFSRNVFNKVVIPKNDELKHYVYDQDLITPTKSLKSGLKSGKIFIYKEDPANELSSAESYAIYVNYPTANGAATQSGYLSPSTGFALSPTLSGAKLFQSEKHARSHIARSFGANSSWNPVVVKLSMSMEDLMVVNENQHGDAHINSALAKSQKDRLEKALSEATIENLLDKLKILHPETAELINATINKDLIDSSSNRTAKKRLM